MSLWISKHSFTTFLFFKVDMPLELWQSCASRNFRYTNLFHSSPPLLPVISLKVKVLVAQSCPTLCCHMDCSPSASSVHGIFQVRILVRVAIPFARGFSWPRNWTRSLALEADSLLSEPPGKPQSSVYFQIKIKLEFSTCLAIEKFKYFYFREPEQLIKFRIKKNKQLSFLIEIILLLLPSQGKKKMLEQIQYMTEIWEILGKIFTCFSLAN